MYSSKNTTKCNNKNDLWSCGVSSFWFQKSDDPGGKLLQKLVGTVCDGGCEKSLIMVLALRSNFLNGDVPVVFSSILNYWWICMNNLLIQIWNLMVLSLKIDCIASQKQSLGLKSTSWLQTSYVEFACSVQVLKTRVLGWLVTLN